MLMLVAFLLSGCGSKEVDELTEYETQMSDFFERLNGYHSALQQIEVPLGEELAAKVSEGEAGEGGQELDASQRILSILDEMATDFHEMAEQPVPEYYINAESMMDEASDYMTLAAQEYHAAIEADGYNEAAFAQAERDYLSANERIGYLITFLQGEMPEGFVITQDEDE